VNFECQSLRAEEKSIISQSVMEVVEFLAADERGLTQIENNGFGVFVFTYRG